MKSPSFEKSFERLEEILEKMHEGEVSLDESLKLYEEADQLLITCSKKLNEAEKRIEVLAKDREGKIQTDAEGNPEIRTFS